MAAEVTRAVRRLYENERKRARAIVMARDGATCHLYEGEQPVDSSQLHVAHITPMNEFRSKLGPLSGTRHSFRDDNVILFCVSCHACQESFDRASSQPLSPDLKAWLDEMHQGKSIQSIPRFQKQYRKIAELFSELKAQRGWNTVDELMRLEGLKTDSEFVAGPTFADVDASQHPRGREMKSPALDALCLGIEAAGGIVHRRGLASDFTAWYDGLYDGERMWKTFPFEAETASPALIFQRPVKESLIGKMKRSYAKSGHPGVPMQLKVSDALYLVVLCRPL